MSTVTVIVRGQRASVESAIAALRAELKIAQLKNLGRAGEAAREIGTLESLQVKIEPQKRTCAAIVAVSYVAPQTLPEFWIRALVKERLSGANLRTNWHGCNAFF